MTTVCYLYTKRKTGIKKGHFFRSCGVTKFVQEINGGEAEQMFPALYQDIQISRSFPIEITDNQWRQLIK